MNKGIQGRLVFAVTSCLFISGCSHRSMIYSHKKKLNKEGVAQINNDDITSLCMAIRQKEKETHNSNLFVSQCEPPPVTIWIYGTLLLKKSFFYRYFNGEMGLKYVHELLQKPKCPGKIGVILAQEDMTQFSLDNFYFFGWSGKLNDEERLRASQHLLKQIHRVIDTYKISYNVYPKITIISHSHGGNIALYLASEEAQAGQEKPVIDRLILLACPVQRKTMPYIYDKMFKRIYALYSSLDMIQVLAPQHPYYRPFSSKQFPKNEKMIQARVKINGKALLHTSFSKKRFMAYLPEILHDLTDIHDQMKIHESLAQKEIVISIKT